MLIQWEFNYNDNFFYWSRLSSDCLFCYGSFNMAASRYVTYVLCICSFASCTGTLILWQILPDLVNNAIANEHIEINITLLNVWLVFGNCHGQWLEIKSFVFCYFWYYSKRRGEKKNPWLDWELFEYHINISTYEMNWIWNYDIIPLYMSKNHAFFTLCENYSLDLKFTGVIRHDKMLQGHPPDPPDPPEPPGGGSDQDTLQFLGAQTLLNLRRVNCHVCDPPNCSFMRNCSSAFQVSSTNILTYLNLKKTMIWKIHCQGNFIQNNFTTLYWSRILL